MQIRTWSEYYVHGTVHLSNTDHINKNEMQVFYSLYMVLELYMLRAPFAFIIRSTINCSNSHSFLSWVGME